MIERKEELKECLRLERELYCAIGYKGKIHAAVTQCEIGKIVSYVTALRKDEYYTNSAGGNFIKKVQALYWRRKHNQIGIKLGISIPINTFGKGLLIYHSQGIIVHKQSRCGNFCKLHGLNCIGNNGSGDYDNKAPILGDGVDIGVGASLIGPVEIADYVKVGAGAVVNKSCATENAVLVGVPAHIK